MGVRRVIDIDVNDAKFKKFKELYDKWQETLGKIPDAFGKAGDEQERMSKGFESMTAALLAQLDLAKSLDEEDEKRVKRLGVTEKLWTSIRSSAQSTARSLLDIGRDLLTVSGVFGIATGASLFGLDRLGASTGDARRSSSGLGLSIGEQRAFTNSFSRFVDPGSFLSGISNAQSDVSKQGALWSIGVNPNQDVASLALDTMRRVRALAKNTDINQLGILESSRHLGDLGIGVEDLRRLRKSSDSEFDKQMVTFRAGVGAQGIDDATAEKWQTFVQKLEAAGNEIQKVLVDALVPLTGPLENLSHSIVELIERLSKNNSLKEGIEKFASWIDTLSGTVSKPEFLAKMDVFVTDLGKVADAVGTVAGVLTNPSDKENQKFFDQQDDRWSKVKGFFGLNGPGGGDSAYVQDMIRRASAQNGANPSLALAIAQSESSMGQNPGAANNGGAIGTFQLRHWWVDKWGENPYDPKQNADMGTKTIAYLDKKYHNIYQELAAYKEGESAFDKQTHMGRDPNWYSKLDPDTRSYVDKTTKVIVELHLPPGGSVLAAAQQIAPN